MNTCYTMRHTDPIMLIFALLIIVLEVTSTSSIQNDGEPVVIPREPFSKIVFVNDLPPGETVTFDFIRGAKVYVSSSTEAVAEFYEKNIHFFIPDVTGIPARTMRSAGTGIDSETGIKSPVFDETYNRISIANENDGRAQLKNPGIIYFLLESTTSENGQLIHNTVYESMREQRNIYKRSDNIDNEYVTILNPSGAVKISNIHHIDGLTALTVSAGGIEQTVDTSYTIHNIGKDDALSNAPFVVVEPVVTFHKQLGVFLSEFEFTVRAVDPPTETVVVPMNWKEWSVGMSENYMLRNESKSFTYVFNASEIHSQFDVQMFGEIGKNSTLTLFNDGYEGAGSQSLFQKHLERESRNTKGSILRVEYNRGKEDTTSGVMVRVHCSQHAPIHLLYISFVVITIRYLLFF